MANSAFTDEDAALLDALGVEAEAKKATKFTPKEERIIAGFEDIQRFVDEHNATPKHGEDRDIFERLYAVRLDRIREQEECLTLLGPMDHQGILSTPAEAAKETALDDDALLEQLGVSPDKGGLTTLKHVRSSAEIKAAEEIAKRQKCEDFDKFKPLFQGVQNDLDSAHRETIRFRKDAGFTKTDIRRGQFIIIGGQTAYIADFGEPIKAPNGEDDARLRVIYSNGTESDILLRSLIRAMYKDETSRLISDPVAGPLFSGEAEADDLASGTVYVLRSKSDHPIVSANREILHKIGVTGGKVKTRIANAKKSPTYLMADVEIVATYELFNINRTKFEKLIHRVFGPAQMKIEITDRFGEPVVPREWFMVPIFVINEAIERFKDGTIGEYSYDPSTASLVKAA